MYKRGFIIFGVVSLTMGNSAFPFGYGLVADAKFVCQLPLGQVPGFSGRGNESADLNLIHGGASFPGFILREGRENVHTRSVESGISMEGIGDFRQNRRKKTRRKPRNCGKYSLTKVGQCGRLEVHTVVLCPFTQTYPNMDILAQESGRVKYQVRQN